MAMNAGQITKDINLIVAELTKLVSASNQGAEALKILTDILERLQGTASLDQFKNLSGTMEEFTTTLKDAGQETGALESNLANVLRAVERLQGTGRLEFGFGSGAEQERATVNVETLHKRLLKAARAGGATKDALALITKELDALEQRGTTEGGIVRLLYKLQREGVSTDEIFKRLIRSAKLWRTELQKQQDVGVATPTGQFPGVEHGAGDEVTKVTAGKTLAENRELYEKILPGGKIAIDNVEKSLNKMGMSLDTVDRILEDGSRDIVRWSASTKLAEGIVRQATITTDAYGTTLKSTSRNLKSFGGGIIANITKVAQWTAAIAIVYAPMRLLNKLTEQAVEVESKLADVQIALASGQESLNEVWKESATVAKELGVDVEGVIDGYVLAVRATANIISPAEKAAATVAVLKDSMILAKLAGIDQAVAMDTLVGALRQLNQPLTAGSDLVDKWVAVSKEANVSLHTLAESFAITATAAENVGLTMDELNGFIAAVAEVTTLSATESGNAVRAFISGFQTDQAERELNKFGIAVKNVNGELRGFAEVIDIIVARKEVGLISDKELGKIAEVIGGGARRGAQVNAFLENYGRVQELAAVSANASGDAAEAMAVKIETLKSALENLNTAFGELARAFGTEGGFLDLVRGSVDSLRWFIEVSTKLVQHLGKATPAIIAFAAAWQYLRKSARAKTFLDKGIDSILLGGYDPERKLRELRIKLAAEARSRDMGAATPRETISRIGGVGRGAVGGMAIGLGVALAAGNADLKRAGTTMGGAAIGQMLAHGKPIGGLIGATIVTALWSNIIDREADLTDAWKRIFTGAYTGAKDAEEDGGKKRDFFEEAKFALGGGEDQWFAKDFGGLSTGMAAAGWEKTLKPSQEGIENATLAIMESVVAVAEGTATPDQSLVARIAVGTKADVQKIYPEVKRLLNEIKKIAEAEVEALEPGRAGTAFGLRLLGITDDLGSQATAVLNKARQELLQEVARGDAGVRELTEFLDIGAFDVQVGTLVTGLTALGAAGMDYKDVAETVITASEQEGIIFERTANEIGALENKYREMEKAYGDYMDMGTRLEFKGIADEIQALQAALTEQLTVARQGQEYKAFEMPTLIQVSPEATEQELAEAVRRATVKTAGIADSLELSGPQRQKLMDSYGTLGLQNAETYRVGLQGITEVSQEVLNDILEDMGLAADAMDKAMTFQQVDLTAAQLPQLYGNMQYYQKLLEPTGLLKAEDVEDIIILTSDHEVDAIQAHSLVMSLALQDLIDISEQQLEGIFNIPEGVTAQIPFTGKLYFSDQPIPTAGGSGIKVLGDAVDSLTGATSDGLVLSTQQVEALQALLLISGGSETFLANIEGLLREAGVEPVERGPVREPISAAEFLETLRQDDAGGIQDVGTAIAEAIAAALAAQAELFAENPELKQARQFQADKVREETVNPELRLHQRFLEDKEAMPGFSKDFTESLDYFSESVGAAVQQPFQQLFDLFSGMFDIGTEGGMGGLGGITSEQVLSALPQSIPVNIQTRITNPVTVIVDGFQVASAIYEASYEDLQSATRRSGAVGYIMEA